ncbi:IS200/IS605 family transposase [Streptomyces sp. NPDC052415]|uniref:IS200/IS605 family transposase n=1 Tax=Streptomyces sp. NPDC052415 TaxID=3365690 RepID=UPI0037D19726
MSSRWETNPYIRKVRSDVHTLHAHVVFTPRFRREVFSGPVLTRCEEVMRKVCEDFGAELREFNGRNDHVHLLVHYPQSLHSETEARQTDVANWPWVRGDLWEKGRSTVRPTP